MTRVAELLQELAQEAPETRRALERVPEHRLDWRPHEKSPSLGQLAMHVATLPGAIVELAKLAAFDVTTEIPRPGAPSVAALLEKLDTSVRHAESELRDMRDADLALPWRMMDGTREVRAITRGALLRTILFNHWYHHRGQLTVYLRLTGAAVPAIYGPSADETRTA